jgi:hypothetical protein
MPDGTSVDLTLLFGPFVVYFVLLVVYYVWEGRRERRMRERYESEGGRAQ